MTTSKKLIKSNFYGILQLVASVLAGFIIMPVMISHLGFELYGAWVLSITITSYLMLLDLGMVAATQRYIVANENQTEKLIRVVTSASVILIGVAILCITITLILSLNVGYFVESSNNSHILESLLLIFGIKSSLLIPTLISNALISAKLRGDIVAKVELIKVTIRASGTFLILDANYGIITLAIFVVLVDLLGAIYMLRSAIKLYKHNLLKLSTFDKETVKGLFHFGKYVFLNEAGQYTRYKSDELVISNGLSLSMLTMYAVPQSLLGYSRQLMTSMLGGMQTVLTRNFASDQKSLSKNFMLFTEISVVISVFIFINFVSFGGAVLYLWVGDGFAESTALLNAMAFLLLLNGVSLSSNSIYFASAKHKYLAYWGVVEGGLNIAFSYIFMQYWGLIGVVFGSLLSSLPFDLCIKPYFACKIGNLAFSRFLKKVTYIVFLSCFYFALVTFLIGFVELDNLFFLAVTCGISSILGILFYCKIVFSAELRDLLKQALPFKRLLPYIF